ncbi:cell envelope opacity-associated protein A [Arthrobacter pigmenti]|uniref:Cell envelope opacity-associated protein A n=1 Tax=Arthrobacter pigmenti TaxID=271432 RepID=A0A846RTA4_9MICC|nr:hypothetical protein [Arthrobacter pigmenti]NJC24279.1 cell envelope opacity-associated protein A [Arthrobacter pigmenti]
MSPTQQLASTSFSTLQRGQQVTLRHASGSVISGVLEDRSDDASVVWVRMDDGAGRRLIHSEDGYTVRG